MSITECKKKEVEDKAKELAIFAGGYVDHDWSYKGTDHKIRLHCKKGHVWDTWYGHLKKGHWCPECAGIRVTEKNVRAHIEDKGGILDSDWCYKNRSTHFFITCNKWHRWETYYDVIKNGNSWCPYCAGHTVDGEEAKKFIINKGGVLNPDWHYVKSTTKFTVTCSSGHSWQTNWNIIQSGHWCPHCRVFKKEREFRKILENYTGCNFPSRRPSWLKYPETNRPLELDGYNESYNMAFEYQGEHHYIDKRFKKTDLVDIQKRDVFKRALCDKRGVNLLVMPFWVPKKEWENRIVNFLDTNLNKR